MHVARLTLVLVLFAACSLGAAAPNRTATTTEDTIKESWLWLDFDRSGELRKMMGEQAPRLTTVEDKWIGDAVTLEELDGKIVLVDFWATWCGPCIKALPKNVKLQKKYEKQGVVFLGVHDARSGHDKMPKVAKDHKLNYPLAVDQGGASTKAWNIQFWPTYFAIDRNGVVRAAPINPDHVEDVIKALLKEQPAPDITEQE